ncbi:MAG: 3-deoxy-D-manno-octulosonic acid transferase [Bacteroidales bacterium]|jgi:3-deoxy-D-manno-octulosonic-acid transferase|nr:3-deoxy-D-manno-octulosonic acid transferase [Bacteroidales bacterium]
MALVYQVFIHIYGCLTGFYALFNHKVRLMVKGRRQTWATLKQIGDDDKVIWVHCASLGEFEQGRVLIERLKTSCPSWKILLSFYSPSGYEVRKNYPYADYVVYLPNDTKANAARFIRYAHPKIAIFVKYEFWFNFIAALSKIHLYQISLIVRRSHYLRRWYGKWFRQRLHCFEHFFVQDEQTADFMKHFGFEYTLCGDTRFDRVKQVAENAVCLPLIEAWCKSNKVLMLGSSWKEDEKLLFDADIKDMKIIIVPHNIDDGHIKFIQGLFPQSLLYSELTEANINTTRLIIVNTIGLLSSLYRYCHIAYVGGGFGKGIHNILEAATYGKPVCFGPNYQKFREAQDLISFHGAQAINSPNQLSEFLNGFSENEYAKASAVCKDYVNRNAGASDVIFEYLKSNAL